MLPSTSRSTASFALQTRAAFSATVSSTGWISVGELAITPRISLVAVCCSSDSLSSWNSRTFSMAMTAWSAKVSRSLICAGVKGRTSVRRAFRVPMISRNHNVSLAQSQHHVVNPTNPRSALDDGVEDRLHIRRRAADDAEHLRSCRLMLEGLAQFRVALAEFPEEPHVFDGDHRL